MSFTPKQARAFLDWGTRGQDELAKAHREAYENEEHPDHAIVVQFANRLMAIAGAGRGDPREPPFDVEGFMGRYYAGDSAARQRLDGVGRAEVAPAPLERPLPGDDALGELRALSPAAAQEQIKRLQTNPEFAKLLTAGEGDELARAGWDLLNEIAAGAGEARGGAAPASSPAPSSPASAPGGARARWQQLEAQILADPKHPVRDSAHPNHQAASAEREAAFSAALHDGGDTQ